jgi:hypothetical protein
MIQGRNGYRQNPLTKGRLTSLLPHFPRYCPGFSIMLRVQVTERSRRSLRPTTSHPRGSVFRPRRTQPVTGWVGVLPSERRLSNPSGIDTNPGAVPGTSVNPYCHTMEYVVGSMTTTRSR